MSRLTIRDKNGEAHMICKQMCGDYGHQCDGQIDVDMCQRYVAFDKLAEYEDLEEQGLLLKLPCKVGDTVYYIEDNKVDKFVVYSFDIRPLQQFVCNYGGIRLNFKNFGKTVFLTKEQAKENLKESEE